MTDSYYHRLGNNLAGQYKRAVGMALHIGIGNFSGGRSDSDLVPFFAEGSACSHCFEHIQIPGCPSIHTWTFVSSSAFIPRLALNVAPTTHRRSRAHVRRHRLHLAAYDRHHIHQDQRKERQSSERDGRAGNYPFARGNQGTRRQGPRLQIHALVRPILARLRRVTIFLATMCMSTKQHSSEHIQRTDTFDQREMTCP